MFYNLFHVQSEDSYLNIRDYQRNNVTLRMDGGYSIQDIFEIKGALCYSCKCEAWETETQNQQELAWQFPRYSVGCLTISVD